MLVVKNPAAELVDYIDIGQDLQAQNKERHQQSIRLSMPFLLFRGEITPLKVEQKITDPNLLISLIFLIFQNAVLRLVSVFDH